MNYIRIPKVAEKMKKAEEFFSPVIMTAPTGYGKTAAVDYYYRRKNPLILSCRSGSFSEMPEIRSIRTNTVVIEDLQWLTDEASIQYLKNLLHTRGIQVVMLTRGSVPKYLVSDDMDLGFVRIRENDFLFGEKEVEEYFKTRGIEYDPGDIGPITAASRGYPMAVYFLSLRMEDGNSFSDDLKAEVWQDILHFWDGSIMSNLRPDYTQLALSVCRYDEFNLEMAEILTGNHRVSQAIEYSHETMGQIRYVSGGMLALRPEVQRFYIWKQELVWSKAEIEENLRNGARYYEVHGDIANALKYYKMTGATQRVKAILIQNARNHPGTAHYVETMDYYFELPKEEVKNSPVLMAGMCMLCSLLMRTEESEEWLNAMVEFEKDRSNTKERRREARAWLAHMEISLPHRGTKGILRIMQNVFSLISKGDVTLPEFSVTGNLPSVMNGGLDFSEWSKNDTQIAKFMGKPIETITGKHGNGLVTLSLAESGLEKGTMSPYEVMTRASDGYEAAMHGGKIEMCFASVGIQIKQHIVEGQLPSARRLYESFREKVEAEKADQLFPNLDALKIRLLLYGGGKSDEIQKYIDSVTDARVFFCILDRYRHMTKLRCLISEDRLDEAMDLAGFMTGYFTTYERKMLWMENEVFKSVILYRKSDEHWRETFISVLKKTAEYHFVRTISREGAAVLPLLNEVAQDVKELQDIPEEFFAQVMEESVKIASFYPDYMRYIPRQTVQFTNREAQILAMLCAGMGMDEIGSRLNISYDAVKKHNRSIYKKLGVKGRAEAERKAAQLGLVRRGINDIGGLD